MLNLKNSKKYTSPPQHRRFTPPCSLPSFGACSTFVPCIRRPFST